MQTTDHNMEELHALEQEVLGYLNEYNTLDASNKEQYKKIDTDCNKILEYIKVQKRKAVQAS